MRAMVVVGNPRPKSRTRHAAELVVEKLTGEAPADVLDLADLGTDLLTRRAPTVAAARTRVLSAELLIVASPTYKATYTGLLKLFLDLFGAGELGEVPTVPLMLAASPHHALAGELTLKPVLVEIGCSCPTPALFLLDSAYESGPALDAWLARARRTLPRRTAGS